MSNAIVNALGSALQQPVAALGLSLGEYSALTAVGAMNFEQAVAIIKDRAIYANGWRRKSGKMAAIMGEDQKLIEAVLAQLQAKGAVFPANYNTFAQLVIGGIAADVDEAKATLTAAGIKRTIDLPVSGAFHTPLLKDAAVQLSERLATEAFTDVNYPVYSNTTSEPFIIADLHETLTKQIVSPTYFAQAMKKMLDAGVDTFIEVGPSDTLIKFAKNCSQGCETIRY